MATDADAALVTAGIELGEADTDSWIDGGIGDLARRLAAIRELRATLDVLANEVEDTLATAMPADNIPISGVGMVKRVGSWRSTWRYDGAGDAMRTDLASAIARAVSINYSTGELDEEKQNIARETMRVAYEAIPSFSALKKAGRKRLGLAIGDYREFTEYYRCVIERSDHDH